MQPIPAKRKAIIVVVALAFFGVMFFLLNNHVVQDAENRKESDFITKHFVLGGIYKRTIKQNTDISYIFLKPENIDINLSFGMDRIFSSGQEKNFNSFSQEFREGDQLDVKMYQPEYDQATKNDLFTKVKNFILNNNNEVEIYNLVLNGEQVYHQDITNTAINFRSGGDLSASNIKPFMWGGIIFFGILIAVKNKISKRKEN